MRTTRMALERYLYSRRWNSNKWCGVCCVVLQKGHRRTISVGGTAAVVVKLQEELAGMESKNVKLADQAERLRDELAEKELVLSRHASFATKHEEELNKMKVE